MVMTILAATTLKADEAQCRDVLHKCDDALKAEQAVNETQKQIIAAQETLIKLQNDKIDEQSIWKPIALGAGAVVILETLILVLKK